MVVELGTTLRADRRPERNRGLALAAKVLVRRAAPVALCLTGLEWSAAFDAHRLSTARALSLVCDQQGSASRAIHLRRF